MKYMEKAHSWPVGQETAVRRRTPRRTHRAIAPLFALRASTYVFICYGP